MDSRFTMLLTRSPRDIHVLPTTSAQGLHVSLIRCTDFSSSSCCCIVIGTSLNQTRGLGPLATFNQDVPSTRPIIEPRGGKPRGSSILRNHLIFGTVSAETNVCFRLDRPQNCAAATRPIRNRLFAPHAAQPLQGGSEKILRTFDSRHRAVHPIGRRQRLICKRDGPNCRACCTRVIAKPDSRVMRQNLSRLHPPPCALHNAREACLKLSPRPIGERLCDADVSTAALRGYDPVWDVVWIRWPCFTAQNNPIGG